MKASIVRLSAALVCAASLAVPALGQAIGSQFTYQGRLQASGAPVNGTADFQFRLFTSSGGSSQVGSTLNVNSAPLANGVFTSTLDFGAEAFNGEQRWLEIAVRAPAGSGNFVILTPRQPMTGTPYARFASKPWETNGTSIFYNNGRVGIGTTAPAAKLDIRSGNNSYVRVDDVNGDLHFNGGTDGVAGIYNDTLSVNARLDFVVNNFAQMVIDSAGQVGIGTTVPTPLRRMTARTAEIFTGRFESTHPIGSVIELSNTTGGVWEWGAAGNSPPAGVLPGAMYFYKQGEQDLALAIMPNQWIGMGVNNPGFRLDLPNIGNADGRGRANQWVTYSSARWKENVQTLDGALDTVKQLRGVSFDWKKEHGGTHDIGFVAEEVGAVVPELVTWEKDGKAAQGLAYDRITALAVEAIKEQQKQIEDLQQANAEMQDQIATLMQLMAAEKGESNASSK